ncbi:hypothetical protein KJ785_03995 [Patescibacteria group bacterium]|nr:hypothetical protein [Patescibacteria group bacterium]
MCHHHSYDRLIDLAQRTGDRLIIHDPIEGRDIVIMDVDEYEKLIHTGHPSSGIEQRDNFEFKDCRDVRGMSSDQMLDQINRDIAIWRAEKEGEEEWEREMVLENEFEDEVPFDPFAEQDYHPADWHNRSEDWDKKTDSWHSTGSVLDDRYSKFEDEDDWEEDEDDDFDFNIEDWSKKNSFDWEDDTDLVGDNNDEIKIEDIPFDHDFNFKEDKSEDELEYGLEGGLKNIPLSDISDLIEPWEEEPLGDEDPVFYEEPV